MNRLHLSALSLILVSTIPAQKALAQAAAPSSPEAALTAAPYTLHVGTSCIGTLHIQGAAGLHEQADMRDVPSGLSFQAGSHDAWLTGSACGENATIQLVAGAAIVSTTMNYDDLKIDWVEGPLSLRQGRGTIHVDKASALLYRGGGPGDLIMGSLTGPATIAISGPGDIHIEKAQSPSIIIGSSGPGDVVIGGGSVDQLAITLSGPGDAIFDGAARIATLRTSASGDIRVHQVVEKEHTHSSASGEIEIAHSSGHSETFTGSTNSSITNNGTRITSDDMLLPDGTRINAHRMIKADGTIVDFDALRHAASEATPPVPPTPPEPPEPPEPPTPPETTDSAMHATTIHTHTDSHPKTEASFSVSTDSGSMTSGVIVLVVLGIVLLRRRIIPRLIPLLHAANPALAKRLEPFLLSLMTRVTTPMPQTQLPQLLDLTERLRKLDRRIGAVETCVTSRDFHLHTQFRDLDRNSG
ncbi:DUF2807 domain-containing protein [Asaia siamensis]|uniref:Putative auto-transporter adhesin head GIN domain-containing protein n=1 Tax=Asaia siamensis TaxID=110479 RepID=A0ABQ1LNR3_9PROT|nr:DUF2807 domain-containing protein [Asaia siamensis]GBR05202.1 hypothetical protein AA0323_0966 [Asaia siamensis NRIC 0323]GGC26437.1 hypothetical protein GCM10007207_09820 [Asaia siamensis]